MNNKQQSNDSLLSPITVRFPIPPARPSLAAGELAKLFGLDDQREETVIAEDFCFPLRAGQIVLLEGPSGSGKSTLLRKLAEQLTVVDVNALTLDQVPLIEQLPGRTADRLALLAGCGLAEPRLALRTPAELSEGERFRFRLAWAVAGLEGRPTAGPGFLLCDEFAAVLDRTLAKVIAYSLAKRLRRAGIGLLAATSHADLVEDMSPDWHLRCLGDGRIEVGQPVKKNDQLRQRALALGRHPCRLAVFRSVALSGPPGRLRPSADHALAPPRADRRLCFRPPGSQLELEKPILRLTERPLAVGHGPAEGQAVAAPASRVAPQLSRGRACFSLRPPGL